MSHTPGSCEICGNGEVINERLRHPGTGVETNVENCPACELSYYRESDQSQALPQGVEEWIEENEVEMEGSWYSRHAPENCIFVSDLRSYLSGMAIVSVEPTDEMIDAAEQVDWSNEDTRASIINMWQVMLDIARKNEK